MAQEESSQSIAELLRRDRRYAFEAYAFVFESLEYAHRVLGMGTDPPAKPTAGKTPSQQEPESPEHHLTGRELCFAIRHFAQDQFGYMARCVLNSWGVYSTSDFGEIVYNLIRIEQMRKTGSDRREDFDNVFNFEAELERNFEIKIPN